MKLRIDVSARHAHFTQKDFKLLFGKNELTVKNRLFEAGEVASRETFELVGPEDKLYNVRVVGPFREESQVEISRSDSIHLGIDAPLKLSGDLPGDKIKIMGPNGSMIKDIAIVPIRHIHLSVKTAKKLRIKNHDVVKIKISGKRALIFDKVVARINEEFHDSIHLDTDEANAAGIEHLAKGELIK